VTLVRPRDRDERERSVGGYRASAWWPGRTGLSSAVRAGLASPPGGPVRSGARRRGCRPVPGGVAGHDGLRWSATMRAGVARWPRREGRSTLMPTSWS